MPVEVGVGYVSIVPEMSRFGPELDRQMSRQQGRLRSSVSQPMADAGADAGQGAGRGVLGGIGAALKGGMVAIAAAGAALFTKGFVDALDQSKVAGKLSAQLGTTGETAAKHGKLAGQLYAKGVVQDVQSGADVIKGIMQQGLLPTGATERQIAQLGTRIGDVATILDEDLGKTARAVGTMMKTGLAKDAGEALDVLTKGTQAGVNVAEDLLDTYSEYSTQFRKLGLDGAASMGLLSQGLKAGARDADTVADSLKEFSIRAIDGSKAAAAGYAAIGLDAAEMTAKIAKGGTHARAGLGEVLTGLRNLKDPVKREAAAVGLFGTKAEDMGEALYSLDLDTAASGLGKIGGAADRAGKALHENAGARIERFKRTVMQGITTLIGDHVLPPLMKTASVLKGVFGPAFSAASRFMSGLFGAAGKGEGALGPLAASFSSIGATVRGTLGPAFGRFTETLRGSLMPALSGLWSLITDKLGPAASTYLGALWSSTARVFSTVAGILVGTVWPAVMRVYTAVAGALGPIISSVSAFLRDRMAPAVSMLGDKLSTLAERAQPAIRVSTTLLSWLGQLAAKVIGTVVPVLVRFAGPVFGAVVSVLGTAIDVIGGVIGAVASFARGVAAAAQAVGSAFSWLWSTVLSPVFSAIGTAAKILVAVVVTAVVAPIVIAFRALGAVASWLWSAAIQPAFSAIGAAATWLYGAAIKPALSAASATFRALGAAGSWLYVNAIQPAFRGIGAVAGWLYRNAIKPALDGARGVFRTLGDAGSWLYRSAIKPAFDGIGRVASWLYREALKPAFDRVKAAVKLVGAAFSDAKDAIGRAWGQIKGIAKKPVNFIIEWVYTKGIKAVWDKVAKFVGLGKLPNAPKLLADGGRTRGGIPGKDSIPALMMADEFVVKRDSARKVGFGALEYINRTGELPVQRFADGGIVSDVWGGIKSGVKKVGSFVGDAVDFLSEPGKMWEKATAFVRDKIAKIGQSKWAQMLGRIPGKMLSGLKTKIVDAATGLFGSGGGGDIGGSGVKRWSSVVLQALKLVGQPASLLPTVLRRMNQESGGNPRAINLWDINARNGVPSKGLMQTIDPTFNAYAGRLRRRGVWDPLANIYASMRYALARYGSLSRAYNRPGGYAQGGSPRPGEVAWVGENGPELLRFGGGGQTIYSNSQSMRIAERESERIAEQLGAALVGGMVHGLPRVAAATARMAQAVPVAAGQAPAGGLRSGDTLLLRIGEREFEAVVDERVDAGLDEVRRRKRAGARGR